MRNRLIVEALQEIISVLFVLSEAPAERLGLEQVFERYKAADDMLAV